MEDKRQHSKRQGIIFLGIQVLPTGKTIACNQLCDDLFVFVSTYTCLSVFIIACHFFHEPGVQKACSRPCDEHVCLFTFVLCFFLYFQQPGKMRACSWPYDDVFVFICTYICACVFITICRFFQQPGKMRACSRPCDDGEQSQRQSCPPDQIQMHGFQQKKNKYKKVQVQIQISISTNTKKNKFKCK